MTFPKINPTQTQAWAALQLHFEQLKAEHLVDLFQQQSTRAHDMSLQWEDFYLDYSKNRIDKETLSLLFQLAEECHLPDAIKAQFSLEKINETEHRAVGHTALRNFEAMPKEVSETLEKMQFFSESVISGDWKGFTGKPIKTVVNIGIGGSDLGPDMVCEALKYYRNHLEVHFVSNVDGDHVMEVLKDLDPETTLFIIVSKSFTTQETLTNAATIRSWFLEQASEADIAKHFVAVSTNLDAVTEFGISSEQIFPMWDWVGGRFSLWSAVGLSIACAVGYVHFEALLRGAHAMDKHFKEAPAAQNMPIILGLLSVWYNNFFEAETECLVPYSQYLSKMVQYLQQAVMESNGKHIDRNGNPIPYQTGTVVWGSTGTNAQHAFFQLLHQGTKLIPTDFIAFSNSLHGQQEHQDKLLANFLAQTEALMEGTYQQDPTDAFKSFRGNQPTNSLIIEKLTPKNLGSLIALYEHKLFVQGVIWNIYSYDQWGVQLGKVVAKDTLQALQNQDPGELSNLSTQNLVKRIVD
ncbi:glucose-6-phosphate isomerase [Altibacter sp. HG106]|uniref:glucose-6-phosphate isomerase n=1 Tax=Altibacter sp. HG106 TaxID=3023937 RepID=UPI0023509D45|nr:glucose-6-phosphate isomerase [Altibacter sp. HG106]MDC7995444.1 glucose-6-phosphate isomerase [Altibacter sp. HG106]